MIASRSCSVALHCVKAQLEVCSASARCGTHVCGSTVPSAVKMVSDLRSGLLARWVKVGSLGRHPVWSGVSGRNGRPLSALQM